MLAPGAFLQDRYQIVAVLGHGGMGAVYQATDRRLSQTVAIKQILHTHPLLQDAFIHEAQLLATLRHPALPKVTDYFVELTGQFLVMEFI
ncbi:MAG: protein kinase, partial [Caldilineaceae bacterium]|nr:protein kinase [Caldilineaceae bacterium]